MAEVHGTCDKRFEALRTALAESLDADDVGASAAVFVDGEPVADLWGGSVRGVRLLSKALCERAREEQYRGIDQILGSSARYGMGYRIFEPAVGWGGWGGSIVMLDLDARMTVAYAMNQMLQGRGGDYRGLGIALAAYEALEG